MRSCSCCHLSWRFRSSSGSQDQRSPCLAWGNTGNDTCQTPAAHPHTHAHKYWWTQSQKKQKTTTDRQTDRQPRSVSSGIRKGPLSTWARTHKRKDTSTTFTTGKEEEKGKTEIVGLPQEHYSNASQRLPTKERERQRKKQMRSKEKWKHFRPFVNSLLIWHATRAAWGWELTETQRAKRCRETFWCRWKPETPGRFS